jgi:two-component system response regulator NreC
MINVLLVEDHHVIRNGLKMLLDADEHVRIVGEAGNGMQALDLVAQHPEIDIILTDLNMPVLDGIGLAEDLKRNGSDIKVVILSMHDNEVHIYKAFKAGAAAYLLKSINPDELLFVLRHVYTGGRYLCSSIAMAMVDEQMENMNGNLADHQPDLELSAREMEVLELLASGVTNQGMSEQLFLSKRTVEGHRQSLIEKFGVNNTAELIRSAMRSGQIR